MIRSFVKNIFNNKTKKMPSNSRTKLRLEELENRLVPNAYVWTPPTTITNPGFEDPKNWTDRATGQMAITAPDTSTDCYFAATSPTTAACYVTQYSTCKSINTDQNWHGDIHVNNNGLRVYGGTSVLKGGTITTDWVGTILAGGGNIAIIGGSFDYDAPDLNQNAAYPSGVMGVYISDGATFTIDRNCLTINAGFHIGTTFNTNGNSPGTDSPGTLLLNPNSQKSSYTSFTASPLGTLLLLTSSPPVSHNFVWSPTTTDTNWSNPNNWVDSVTGLKENNAPGANDDVVFGATSPTRCDLFTNGSCQTITTDASWNGHIVLHNSKLSVYGVNAPSSKSSAIDGGAIDAIFGGTIDEIGGEFDYAVSELGASLTGLGKLNVAVENGGKFIVDKECQTINAYLFVGQSYPYFSNPPSLGTLEFDTTDPTLTYSMSVRSMVSVGQKGIVNFIDESKMSGLALVDYGTVNLGADVVLTTPAMGLLHSILVESGGVLNTAPMGTIDTINGDLNVLSGGKLKMNGDGAGLYSNLIVTGTLTIGGTVDVGFDIGYVNGSTIQANQTNILQGSILNITTEGTPQPAGFPYLFPVVYGPITGSFSTVNGVNDLITFNDGQEMVVEWMQG